MAVLGSDTRGGASITIRGANFGPDGNANVVVTYGPDGALNPYTAASCAVTGGGHDTITCSTVEGIGNNLYWVVQIAAQSSVRSVQKSRYLKPSLTSLSGNAFTGRSPTQGQERRPKYTYRLFVMRRFISLKE